MPDDPPGAPTPSAPAANPRSAACDGSGRARKAGAEGVRVSLPVLPGQTAESDQRVITPGKAQRPHSHMGWKRAVVLILVHVVFIVHFIQWQTSDDLDGVRNTLSPIEPSESMFTLEQGLVNAGFVVFSIGLLSTILFGRFFCGWLCHVVALQDFCGWIMKKIGVHPKPFRSRLLIWFPLLLALYMFVWPTFRREVIAPLIGVPRVIENQTHYVLTPTQAAWLGEVQPLVAFQRHFIVEDFWATFPPWYVAIPFVLVIGFAIVYFLGAKGFCTYGCPYGGFFAPLDTVSPTRIRVTDDCEQCGHCTAVCTSNVRVHEEVRDFKMVVDPGCMKCLDCVSACPNDALYLGLGAPALLKSPRSAPEVLQDARAKRAARFDLSLAEELALGAAFLLLLNGYRGMYGEVPLLMAVGIVAILVFMIHKTWRLLRDANVRAPFWQLKRAGRVTPAGALFALVTTAFTLVGVQGLVMKVGEWVGDGSYLTLNATRDQVFAANYAPAPEVKARAEAARAWYRLSAGVGDGGVGFFTSWGINVRLSWLSAVAGDWPEAERYLRAALAQRPRADLAFDLATMMSRRGAPDADVRAMLSEVLRRDPLNHEVRRTLAADALKRQQPAEAVALYDEGVRAFPHDIPLVIDAAELHLALGNPARAAAVLGPATLVRTHAPRLFQEYARALFMSGQDADAAMALERAVALEPTFERYELLADIYRALGRDAEAKFAAQRAQALRKAAAPGHTPEPRPAK